MFTVRLCRVEHTIHASLTAANSEVGVQRDSIGRLKALKSLRRAREKAASLETRAWKARLQSLEVRTGWWFLSSKR